MLQIRLLYQQVEELVHNVVGIEQTFFKRFKTVPGKPWLTEDGQYLLFDYVHL